MVALVGAYTGTIVSSAPNRDRMHMYDGFLGRPADFRVDFSPATDFAAMGDSSIPYGWKKFDTTRLAITMPLIPANGSTLANAAAGTYNANYATLLTNFLVPGYKELIVRLGHEFNGTWYAWRADNGKEADFAAAWRNAVTNMRNQVAEYSTRVLFDWCPTWGTPSNCNVEACYPGDDYVDIIGIDIYNQHFPIISDPALRWQAILTNTYGLNWVENFARLHNKPISFPEWGTGFRMTGGVPDDPQNGGGDDPLFIRNMADWISRRNVYYHSYWDFAADLDCRISNYQFTNSARAYRKAFRKWASQ